MLTNKCDKLGVCKFYEEFGTTFSTLASKLKILFTTQTTLQLNYITNNLILLLI
jgi:hypothetical protein